MSFATLSKTLDDCSAISTLNLTRNPFDSATDGRLNLPALSESPSIFLQTNTPGSQKKKGFRWSIEQISKLDPADIDEFPNQDYSSACEKPEDEEKVQKAINEYFSHGTILPSPWTPENHVKHVTFSPHPPSTTYISVDEDSMTDISHNSTGNTSGTRNFVDGDEQEFNVSSKGPSSGISRGISRIFAQNLVYHLGTCCQTSLTFPPSFDLSKIVDSGFYSYVEEEGNSVTRDLNVSSLRRKLFSPEEQRSPIISRERQPPRPRVTRSILKSPSPMNNLRTSSPMHNRDAKIHLDSNSPLPNVTVSGASQSPAVSPIKSQAIISENSIPHGMSSLNLDGSYSNDDVFKSDVLESSDIHIDPQFIPDVSPIKSTDANEQDELGDGGPMKISELSHVSMELENEVGNVSSVDMDIAEIQPLKSDQHRATDNERLETNEIGESCSSRDNVNDVSVRRTGDNVMNCDLLPKNRDDIMAKNNDDGRRLDAFIAEGVHRVKDSGGSLDMKGYSTTRLDSWENIKDVEQGVTEDSHGDEALVQRACAAIKRADRVVRESCLEQDTTHDKKTGTSIGYVNVSHVGSSWRSQDKSFTHLRGPFKHVDNDWNYVDHNWNHVNDNWSHVDNNWNHVNGSWHPIDMSTPLVNEKPKNKPQKVETHVRRSLLETDSYNNLLSSFANSKLDPQLYTQDEENHPLNVESVSGKISTSRARSKGHGTKVTRSFANAGNSISNNFTQDAYLSGRYGYNGSFGKRSSWPPRYTTRSRFRYSSERSASPTNSSGLRRRSAEDRPRLRRSVSEDLKKYSRRSHRLREDRSGNQLYSELRRNFRI